LSEIRDIPRIQKLAIFGEGSILGEEDFLKRESYSCTLACHSPKGTLYKIPVEMFELLRQNEPSWDQIAIQAKIKESHQRATYIKSKPRNFEKEDRIK
jgi:CRP-like cAMP-binding protein